MDLTQREEQVLTADDTVGSLGLVFMSLPPLPPPPMIVKHVHEGTWAENAGIGPGCEVLELGGLKVGSMTREEFTQAIKSRPLRIRVQPPNCGAWKQVAHFQKETVRLQFKKVMLQKALRDEHDKVKTELGIDIQAEEDRKNKNNQTKAEILQQRQRVEDQKQQLVAQEAELQKMREKCEVYERETQNRRKAMQAESLYLEKQQAELDRARHEFNEMRKNALEALEKEKQEVASERKKLEAQKDVTSIAQEERDDLESERHRLQQQSQELLADRATFEAAVEQMKVDLEQQKARLLQERAEMEEDVEEILAQQKELQAQKAKMGSLETDLEKQKAELKASKQEISLLQEDLQKERTDFNEKCQKVQRQLVAQKRQLVQVKNKLLAEKTSIETARAEMEKPCAESIVQTEGFAAVAAVEGRDQEAQTDPPPVELEDETENTDPPPPPEVVKVEAERVEVLEVASKLLANLRDPNLDPQSLEFLTDQLGKIVRAMQPGRPAEPISKKAQKLAERSHERYRSPIPRSPSMEQKLERSPLRRLSPDGPQSERLAKQKLAQTEIVRKLLAHELRQEEPSKSRGTVARSLPGAEVSQRHKSRLRR